MCEPVLEPSDAVREIDKAALQIAHRSVIPAAQAVDIGDRRFHPARKSVDYLVDAPLRGVDARMRIDDCPAPVANSQRVTASGSGLANDRPGHSRRRFSPLRVKIESHRIPRAPSRIN